VTLVETLGNLLRFAGFVAALAGLWYSAGGLRVVVSGRIDERHRSANSLKRGVPLLVLGIVLFVGGTWLVQWAG
jgi:hypothetical protein